MFVGNPIKGFPKRLLAVQIYDDNIFIDNQTGPCAMQRMAPKVTQYYYFFCGPLKPFVCWN